MSSLATSWSRSFLLALLTMPLLAQSPPAKGPDKEIAEKVAVLKEVVADKKFTRDAEGLQVIDFLLQKVQGTIEPKDRTIVVKALGDVFTGGKVRPHDKIELYVGAAAALGYCGPEGAKVLKAAFQDKRFPEKTDWVPLREQLLKNLGRTKDESMIKFLCNEARRNHEAGLQAAAGEALGNFEDSKEELRKDIVSELLIRYGELNQLATQIGSSIDAQNAQDRLSTLKDKWNSTLAKLTKQNFDKFGDWQAWYNKNKSQPW